MQQRLHLKGLNGLRAMAAISVVLSHLRIALPEYAYIMKLPFGFATYAVTIFFTISGFLITFLLFKEKEQGTVSIKNFYVRRILRIWPLYFIYLAAAILTIYVYTPKELPGSLIYYLVFAANIPSLFHSHLPYLAQYWTLGVEEQFYFFWPWIMKKTRNVLRALIIFTACFLLLKLIFRFIYFKWGNIVPLHLLAITRFECMSLGGIAAVLCIEGNKKFMRMVTNKFIQVVCWLSLAVMILDRFHISPLLDHDMAALVTIVLITNLSFNDKSLVSLENRFFDFIGKISFGIYMIHPLVIFYYSMLLDHFNLPEIWKIACVFVGVLFFTIFFAWLSYEFIEKRFLALKDKFTTIKNSDSKYDN